VADVGKPGYGKPKPSEIASGEFTGGHGLDDDVLERFELLGRHSYSAHLLIR